MKKFEWLWKGYADARERSPYKRAPAESPPALPDHLLSADWQEYLDGWNAGIKDGVRKFVSREEM